MDAVSGHHTKVFAGIANWKDGLFRYGQLRKIMLNEQSVITDKWWLFGLGFENANENPSLSEIILLLLTYLSCLVLYTVYVI